jgi:hypothetical protein
MGAEPERIDPRGTGTEKRERLEPDDAANPQPVCESEAACDQKERDALVAEPAHVAHRRGEEAERAGPRRPRELRDPNGERRPPESRVSGEFAARELLDDVVEHDPDQRDALERVEPAEPAGPPGRHACRHAG